jgi:hypothetical protein
MSLQLEEIQPGWLVVAADGEELGKVIAVDGDWLRIKKEGLLGGELRAPREAVSEVETGRVELNLRRGQLS